jgi:hypothetical protein
VRLTKGVDTAVEVAVKLRIGMEGSVVKDGGTEGDRNWDVKGTDLESN